MYNELSSRRQAHTLEPPLFVLLDRWWFGLNKSAIRNKLLDLRRSLPQEALQRKSLAIARRVFKLPEVAGAKKIMFYAAIDSEVDTWPMIAQALKENRLVCLPTVDRKAKRLQVFQVADPERDLCVGSLGIREPKGNRCPLFNPRDLQVVIVPGVGFDLEGYRLGYGGGYYDRFLREAPGAKFVALAFECQVLPRLPREEHDVPVHILVTEDRVIYCPVSRQP